MKFENKVAIITGSTRGIGRATAELFAKEGAKVIVVGTKEELGESCVNAIRKIVRFYPNYILWFTAKMQDRTQWRKFYLLLNL